MSVFFFVVFRSVLFAVLCSDVVVCYGLFCCLVMFCCLVHKSSVFSATLSFYITLAFLLLVIDDTNTHNCLFVQHKTFVCTSKEILTHKTFKFWFKTFGFKYL